MLPLNEEQSAAAQREGQNACCVAGPGSGKTRVLVERFAWFVEKGIDPQQILAITFTEKATREMKGRLARRYESDLARRRQVERASVYTIDGFCNSLLRAHALRAGLDPEFQILDERDARLEAIAAIETVLDRYATGQAGRFMALLSAWSQNVDEIPGLLLGIYHQMRTAGGVTKALSAPTALPSMDAEVRAFEEGFEETLRNCPPRTTPKQKEAWAVIEEWWEARKTTPLVEWLQRKRPPIGPFKTPHPLSEGLKRVELELEELRQNLVTVENEPHRRLLGEILLDFETEFTRRKRARAALDFADLNEQACLLLQRNRDIQKSVRERYRQVLMDELQDTNPLQWELVRLVSGERNLFAVGDINQSIYGFRRAEPRIFLDFRESIQSQGVVDRLTLNYRSDPGILDTVNRVAKHCKPGVEDHELKWPKDAVASSQPVVELLNVSGEGHDDSTEAEWVAWRVRKMLDEAGGALKLSSIAVLARTTKTFDVLEEAFERFAIPCLVKRGRNFFAEPEIVDLTNWLRVLDNPQNEAALVGLLRSPFFGWTDEEIYRRKIAGRLEPDELQAARRLRAELPIDQLLSREIDRRGFLKRLKASQQANVSKFLQLLREMERRQEGGLGAWIEAIESLRSDASEPNALAPEAEDAVEILTVHSAKGLEWSTVILTAMAKGAGGRPRSVNWSPTHGIGCSWDTPCESVDRHYVATSQEGSEREKAEELRLLYVAMTRAKEKLVMVWRGDKPQKEWVPRVVEALQPEFPEVWGKQNRHGSVSCMRVEGSPECSTPSAADGGEAARRTVLSPLPLTLQPPPSVSVTALAHFQDCPRRHLLAQVLHWPQAPAAAGDALSSGAMALGTEVHEILAGLRESSDAAPASLDLAENFRRSELGQRAARAARMEREFDFLVDTGDMLLQGAIDLWFEDEAGVVLVDYKSDQQWSSAKEEDYSAQLRLYALALARHTGKPVSEAWIFRLRDATALPVDLGGDLGLSLIQKYRDAAQAGEYPMRPAERCRWCPYRHDPCPAE